FRAEVEIDASVISATKRHGHLDGVIAERIIDNRAADAVAIKRGDESPGPDAQLVFKQISHRFVSAIKKLPEGASGRPARSRCASCMKHKAIGAIRRLPTARRDGTTQIKP